MNCRDVREVADSFLCDELLTETNHEILQHLDTCASCRAEVESRRRLRRALGDAFDRAPDLRAQPDFLQRLRVDLHEAAIDDRRSWTRRRFALAAGVMLAAGLGGALLLRQPALTPSDALAQDAIGDHRNCALKFRLVRNPIPLEEAAQRFDGAFRALLTEPPDEMSTPGGAVTVVERHSCAYGDRRFGHIVLRYQDHVVSLLVTANQASETAAGGASPHVIGQPANGLSVVSINGERHAVLLVSDLASAPLTQLSHAVALPLAQRLTARINVPAQDTMASMELLPALHQHGITTVR